jgi:hypothetical protein
MNKIEINKYEKVLFVALTPYQIFNCINIKYQVWPFLDADIKIIKNNDGCDKLVEVCKNSGCFNDVELVDIGELNPKNKIAYVINRIVKSKIIKLYLKNPKEVYSQVFIEGTEIYSKAVYRNYKKNNKNIKLAFYEDGLASYTWILDKNYKKKRNYLTNIILGEDINNACRELWVYKPEIVNINTYEKLNIKEIPRIEKNSKLRNLLNRAFGYKFQDCKLYKYIFFDANFIYQHLVTKQMYFVNTLNDKLDSFSVKLHPSSSDNKYAADIACIDTDMGMEMFCLNNDLKNNILISVMSTSCVLDLLLFDEMPYVIYLYKIIGGNFKMFNVIDIFINNLKQIYPNRIFAPESEDELYKILNHIEDCI